MRRFAWRWVMASVAVLMLSAVSFGHAVLETGIPGRDSTVHDESLREVRLRFTEAVHVNQSVFRVYALADHDDPLLVKAVAGELASTVPDAVTRANVLRQALDEPDRADLGLVATQDITDQIIIRMPADLAPGPYVVMWKVRSIDTHITDGFYVFYYAPQS